MYSTRYIKLDWNIGIKDTGELNIERCFKEVWWEIFKQFDVKNTLQFEDT